MVSPDVPSPMHGFELAAFAFFRYFTVAGGLTYGLEQFGFPADLAGFAFLASAALLLKPLLPMFRRRSPDRPDTE